AYTNVHHAQKPYMRMKETIHMTTDHGAQPMPDSQLPTRNFSGQESVPSSLSPFPFNPSLSPLPTDHLERVWSWGMASSGMSYVYRPTTTDGIREVFQLAKHHGVPLGIRGAGRSYADASLASESICLDLPR